MFKFSASTNGFYIEEIHGANIPKDAVDVTDAAYRKLLEGQSAGKTIVAGDGGAPILKDRQMPSLEDDRRIQLDQVRVFREPVLNRLAGIGMAAQSDGDNATLLAVKGARSALLEITDWPAIKNAKNRSAIRSAIVARYQQIVEAAPEVIKKAFPDFPV